MTIQQQGIVAAVLHRMRGAISTRRGEHQTDYQGLRDEAGDSLETEYERLVLRHLAQWGVHAESVVVRVDQLAPREGKEVFKATIYLVSWHRTTAVRVLLGLPILENKIRKVLQTLWLSDVSAFDGLAVQVSQACQQPATRSELRRIIVGLTTGERSAPQPCDAPELQNAR